jgi:hypothetical protein
VSRIMKDFADGNYLQHDSTHLVMHGSSSVLQD